MGEETLGRAVLALSTDNSGLDSGLNAAHGKTQDWVGKVGKVLGGIAIGALVIKGVNALTDGMKDIVGGAIDAQNIQAQLGNVLESTGGKAGMTAASINALAASLQAVTPFEDDVIVAGQNMLLTFTSIGKDVFPAATETMLNMSTAMGTDLQSSAIQLGKALNDPIAGIGALSRVGVQFTADQKEQIKVMVESGNLMGAQKVILGELQTEFGGAATAAGTTFAGQMSILNNQISGVKDELGLALIPVLSDLAKKYGPDVIVMVKDLAGWMMSDLIPAIRDIAQWMGTNLPPAIASASAAFRSIRDTINDFNTFTNNAMRAVQSLKDLLGRPIPNPFQGVLDAMSRVSSFKLPSWMTNTYHIPGFASGTSYAPGGFARVGENGPEVVALPRGSQVYPNGQGPSMGGITINQTFAFGTPEATRQAAYSGAMSGLDAARARGLR